MDRSGNKCYGNIGRDLNAVLRNMLYIVEETIRTGERPEAFRRSKIDEGLSHCPPGKLALLAYPNLLKFWKRFKYASKASFAEGE